MTDYVASCFISYNHADAPLARGIAAALQARGYYVWIDEGQIKLGDSLIQSIGAAIDQVDFLIAIVSDNSVQSSWCQKELALAMTGELNRRQISVLPCRVGSPTMPPSLADKLYMQVGQAGVEVDAAGLDRYMRLHLAPTIPIPKRLRAQPQGAVTGGNDRPRDMARKPIAYQRSSIARLEPRQPDGPLEVVETGPSAFRILLPLEGGGRLGLSTDEQSISELRDSLRRIL
ncbi:toll/interleukin-1 receptor domain-containing protein [Humibacillus xanthopallidus]|uniref:toll/interleukin-1 receptor domain-containing protein n=1 Tax=Humibacillus xanthopallidus TaxID=412689 RepID=UPI001153E4FD|nr:toll/interleukin-1 receptor domain-containing protein [Humibacillus xanthopallidus]